MKIQHAFTSGTLAALITLSGLTPAYSVDIIERISDPAAVRGTIKNVSPEAVEITKSGGDKATVSIPASDIKSVSFDGEPDDLRSARSSERSGSFDSALEKLTKAKAAAGNNNRVKAEIDFLTARILANKARTDADEVAAAKDALEKFRSANKTNFRYFEATLLHAAMHGIAKEADAGKALLQEVQASSVKDYQLKAGVELGNLLLADGETDAALAAFNDVVSKSQSDNSPALFEGMLGQAACQRQQNQLDQAISTLDEIISKANSSLTSTLAEAWVRKGDCFRQKGENKAALMAYLHVDVLYPGEPAQHAESLLRLSQLWGPSGHQDRAAEAGARLAEKYPNSQWARSTGAGG